MERVALITGGSSGLGLELARQLLARNYRLILIARDADKLKASVDELNSSQSSPSHDAVAGFACDVSDHDRMKHVFEKIQEQFGRLDLLVNCAGIASVSLLQDCQSPVEIARTIDINLTGTISATYLALPLMHSGARILFVSSGFGLVGSAGYSLYAASKGGMNNFADALRRELLGRGVSVHVACPGDIDTPMYQHELKTMPDWILKDKGRSEPITAELAAKRILAGCDRNNFLITTSSDVKLLLLVKRLLPHGLATRLIDQFLPVPSYAPNLQD